MSAATSALFEVSPFLITLLSKKGSLTVLDHWILPVWVCLQFPALCHAALLQSQHLKSNASRLRRCPFSMAFIFCQN